MTPTPDAVKASYSAIDQCLRELDLAKPSRLGTDLLAAARAELSALRRGVSVEEVVTRAMANLHTFARSRYSDRECESAIRLALGQTPDEAIAAMDAVLALVETGKGVKP